MADFHSIYKYLVKFSFIVVTAIFIGWAVHFALQNILLGKQAYIYTDNNCEYQYGFGSGAAGYKTMPVVQVQGQKPLTETERKAAYDQCVQARNDQQAIDYKRGMLSDISAIVSLFFVSAFLLWADRKTEKD